MITAVIDAGQHYCQAVSDLWQWDYGQTLRIQGVKIPAAVEVQFSTTERIGETVTRIGVTKDGVTEVPIPDTLLEGGGTTQDYTIYAFVYIENGDSGKTEYRVSMKVRARPKPEAHATPEEGELFWQAIVAVAESADRAESARKSAEASADEAKTSKENAETAAKNAEAFKTETETAKTEAVQAATEATAAKESAEEVRAAAEKAKQDAEAAKATAEKLAKKVETAKEEIQESADQIQKNAIEIDSLKEDLGSVAIIGFQYLDKNSGERNEFYTTYGTSRNTNDSNYVAFPIVTLPAGKYYTKNLSDVFTFLDDGTSLKNYNGYNADDKTLTLDTLREISVTGFGDTSTQMTISNVNVIDDTYGIISVEITGDDISNRTATLENKTATLENKTATLEDKTATLENKNIITVGVGKDFSTIKSAVESIKDSSKMNIYDIYIDDGVYDEYAITLPDFVNLIGVSGNREKCIIRGELPDSASADEITVNSTINLKDSNTIENLTITAKNLRYPIHSESGGNHINWRQILNNCYVEHFGNTSPNNTWTSYHAWGEGASSGSYAEFNNCIFKSPAEPWYVHEFEYLPDVPKPYHHVLNNCEFINTTISTTANWLCSVVISNVKNSDIINTIDFNNCSFGNGELAINDTCSINVNVHGCNNVAIRTKNRYPNTDYANVKTYIGTESVTKHTILKFSNGINLVEKADASTPADMIAGIAVEDCEPNSLVKIVKGSYVPKSVGFGKKIYCDDNGQFSTNGTIEIGICYGQYSLIY